MPAAERDYTIEQGATFRRRWQFKQVDGTPFSLVGYGLTLKAQSNRPTPEIDLSLGAGFAFVTDGSDGKVDVTVDESVTATLQRDLWFTVDLVGSGDVTRLIEGRLRISRQVA